MYNTEEEYLKATRDAQVNTYVENGSNRGLWLFTNMLLLLALVVVGFLYFTQSNNYLSENLFGKKTAVLGVSHRSTESDYTDKQLMAIVNNLGDELTQESKKANQQATLSNEMSQLMNESDKKNESNYESAVAQELNGKVKGVKGRIVLVKKGDSVSSD